MEGCGHRARLNRTSTAQLLIRHQFDAAVLRPAGGGAVRRHEMRLPKASRNKAVRRDAVIFEILRDCISTPLREFLIVAHRADRIAVAVDLNRHVRVLLKHGDRFVKDSRVFGPNIVLVEIKVHTTQNNLLRRRWRRWWRRRWWRRRWRRSRRRRRTTRTSDQRTKQSTGDYAYRNGNRRAIVHVSGGYACTNTATDESANTCSDQTASLLLRRH